MLQAFFTALFGLVLASSGVAGTIDFSDWKEQRLSLFSSNDYTFGAQLEMLSEGAVSIAYSRISEEDWGAGTARWSWRVDQSVPPTDLSKKGGDDRNISLYFVFLSESDAQAVQNRRIRALVGRKSLRVIQYAWGGNHARGQFIRSPFGPRGQGVTVALRQAGTGQHSEAVDLARDFKKAFGTERSRLVGLAVSGDSDDTDSVIRAVISDLVLN